MTNTNIYQDIATRTGGDIYIGVVGPVRTGKSTFIKRFMETLVLPNMENSFERERAKDEMPQSSGGKTVMTTEPKFVPDEAVTVTMENDAKMRIKMVDCVGYIVPGALGQIEDGKARMVMTPWSAEPMPFREAAETGTRKVITDHATIGVVVTTDGTIGDLGREEYEEAERKVIAELQAIGKPFVVVLNSGHPESEEAAALAYQLEDRYHAPVALVNCLELDGEDIRNILELVLSEFPMRELRVDLPEWTMALESDHSLRRQLTELLLKNAKELTKVGEISAMTETLSQAELVASVSDRATDLGKGTAMLTLALPSELYYQVLSDWTGLQITDQKTLMETIRTLSQTQKKYDQVASALEQVEATGYGIVLPSASEMTLAEPELMRQAGGYGVRLCAKASSIHMIRAEIEAEVNPIVGTKEQTEDLLAYLQQQTEQDSDRVWEYSIFGRTLQELIGDSMQNKIEHMTPEARQKLSETLERVINEGSGGLVCIIL